MAAIIASVIVTRMGQDFRLGGEAIERGPDAFKQKLTQATILKHPEFLRCRRDLYNIPGQ
jgi:hypothetical protein